jgi:hypothetical protein
MSVRVADELVVLGDVAVHPAQFARPGLEYVYDDDPGRASRTREEVLSDYGDRILACGHVPGTASAAWRTTSGRRCRKRL